VAVVPVGEEGAPAGPSEAEEATFLSEQTTRGAGADVVPVGVSLVAELEDAGTKLPGMDELVQRIPADIREVMDELFRVKFVRVQRVPKKALQS
jgi:hypothetical protein